MDYKYSFLLLICVHLVGVQHAVAEATGRSAAMKYFVPQATSSETSVAVRAPASSYDNLLAISVGSLVDSKSYQWIGDDFNGWNIEAAHLSPAGRYFSRGFHFDFQKFTRNQRDLTKLSFLISFSFPRRQTFPVYLGIAFGPGYFLKQQQGESEYSLDYKGYVGLRLSKSYSQYFIESGVKNHVHMLSNGQFIGWFFSSGVAYKF